MNTEKTVELLSEVKSEYIISSSMGISMANIYCLDCLPNMSGISKISSVFKICLKCFKMPLNPYFTFKYLF